VAKNISEADVRRAVGQVMHPQIDRSLVELGMLNDIALKGNEIALTLVLPFLGIPIAVRDYLKNGLRQAVTKLGAKVEIRIAEMNQEQRSAFLAMEQESWKGLA